MVSLRYAYCNELYIRRVVAQRLKLPLHQPETPAEWWTAVERGGRLLDALALYDRIDAERAARRRVRRETKKQFAERIDREGRRSEAEQLRADLLSSGLSQREAQIELVARLQPLDGSTTRAWPTPNPWQTSRLFLRRVTENWLYAQAAEEEYYEADDDEYCDPEEAENRIKWAKRRLEERRALSSVRWRARLLREQAAQETKARAQEAAKAAPAAPPANGSVAGLPNDTPGNGAAVEPATPAAPKPVEQTYSVWYKGFRVHYTFEYTAIACLATAFDMPEEEVSQRIRDRKPLAENLSQHEAQRQKAILHQDGVYVSVKPQESAVTETNTGAAVT